MSRFNKFPVFVLILFFFGCKDVFTPKPKGYFRIELPEKSYQVFAPDDCPFRFEVPVYAEVERDTTFFSEKLEEPCWMDIIYPELGGKLHLSYKQISPENTLGKLVEDAYKLAFKHTIKAEYIDESIVSTSNNVHGIIYEVGGNTASNYQFYLTDSLQHFLRGSLYFSSSPNEDSLSPVIQFVKADVAQMIRSFEWK